MIQRFICLFKSFVPLQCVVVGLTFKPLCEAVEKFAHCRAGVFTEQTFHMSLIVLLLLISCFTPAEPVCSPVREATLSSAGSSTLTINSVSRTDPFNMEVKWTCLSCGVDPITACEKLEVYAPPESPSCTVREDTESGDIKSVTVSCSTSKVYPKARCRFYRTKDGGHSVEITNPVYSHTETGDPAKVTGTPADKTVTLSFSQASHSCRPEAVQGYFLEESTTCTCSLSSDGHPRGTAQWYKGGQLVGSGGTLVVSRDRSNPESVQTYTCEAVSDLGQKLGTTLTAKFAYVPEVTFTLDPAQTTFNKGDNLELKCSGQGNPDPTLTLTTKETTDNLTNDATTELTHTLTLDCMDTSVYVCSGQNSQGTNRKEISIGVRCPQQLSPLFNSKPQVDAAIRETAKLGIEIYGFPEPRTLTLQRTDDDSDLISAPRHSVQYTAGEAPFGVVNVTIFDLVEADYTNYTLTLDNGLRNALVYTFYLNEVVAGAPEESIVNKDDSLNISSIVIGVIAAVIITCLIVVNIFLVKKNRGLKKERLDFQYKNTKQSNPQSLKNDDYLVPLEVSTITSHVSISVHPKPRQTYNSTSRQNVEPMSVYHDLEPNHLTIGNLGSCGPYSNVPDPVRLCQLRKNVSNEEGFSEIDDNCDRKAIENFQKTNSICALFPSWEELGESDVHSTGSRVHSSHDVQALNTIEFCNKISSCHIRIYKYYNKSHGQAGPRHCWRLTTLSKVPRGQELARGFPVSRSGRPSSLLAVDHSVQSPQQAGAGTGFPGVMVKQPLIIVAS
ncbi:hypothetical protein RRG08_061710 [Elysia crispata]|uniref:Ig-like domain-containing protein n=1 Tax=Elysia crispata TaxID=231223 RepID=A0AAE0Y9E9_9GAST|nr:hypothetical protein RRG08_061710 [Elysia crispata]